MAAYIGAVLFLGLFASFGAQAPVAVGAAFGIAAHLVLLPVVAALPAPPWARAAGYGWLVIDTALNVLALQASQAGLAADQLALVVVVAGALRQGIHASAALWVGAAAWHLAGATKAVGLAAAALLAVTVVAPPTAVNLVYVPAFPAVIAWLALVGRRLSAVRPVLRPADAL